MNASKILEFVISDILIASMISGIFAFVSNKNGNKNEKLQEKKILQN